MTILKTAARETTVPAFHSVLFHFTVNVTENLPAFSVFGFLFFLLACSSVHLFACFLFSSIKDIRAIYTGKN